MKTLKKQILLSLSLPVDFFHQGEGFSYQPYSWLYFLLTDYRRGSIREAVNGLTESGEVDKLVRDKRPFFRLTGLGRQRLLSFFPIALGQKRVWDRRWRIVVINSQRPPSRSQWRQARKKMKNLGFRLLTKGVYLTPMPVSNILQDFFTEKNLLGRLFFIDSRRFLAGDDQKLAKNVWKWDEIAEKYQSLIKDSKRLLKTIKIKKKLEDEGKTEVSKLFSAYFSILSLDPGLPKKVLPTDWPGDLAREAFLAIFDYLKSEEMVDVL